MKLNISNNNRGAGNWKLNNSFLMDTELKEKNRKRNRINNMYLRFPANTEYFQNIFKRTEKKLLETFTINMNKTLAKCSITIGKTLVK